MQFTVRKEALLTVLIHMNRVIPKRSAMPMFQNFVFTIDEGEKAMTVQASDGEGWMMESVAIDEEIKEKRAFSVYYYTLLRTLKGLEDQPLCFEVSEYQMKVTHSYGSFRLPIQDAEEFLNFPRLRPNAEAKDCKHLYYEVPGLKSVLTQCSFAVANDELRPVMGGVYVNLTKEHADYVASDGLKLVRVQKDPMRDNNDPVEASFIIPAKIVGILLRILPSTGDVYVNYQEIDGKAVASVIIDGNLTYTFRLIDGVYPKYWQVIPQSFAYEVKADRKLLIKSIDRQANFTSSNMMIRFEFRKEDVQLSAKDTDYEIDSVETLPIERRALTNYDEDCLNCVVLGMNYGNIAAILKRLNTEKVKIKLRDKSSAFVIEPEPQPSVENITMLMMPMLTD